MSLKAIRDQEERLKLFEKEVNDPQWKKDHAEAMKCLAFEETLRFGVMIYESLIALDEHIRSATLKGECQFDPKVDDGIRKLFEWWLRPCAAVEEQLQALIKAGFTVQHGDEFRKYHEEAIWMLKSASEAFDHPRIVECRDRAIDSLRANEVTEE